MGRLLQLLTRASASGAWWPGCPEFSLADAVPSVPLKVLLVVAHPDDESECAATLYRITHGLGGVVDQVIVTNGAGGQHFSAPGLEYYGLSGSPGVAKALPRLRRREVMRAGQIVDDLPVAADRPRTTDALLLPEMVRIKHILLTHLGLEAAR